MGRGLWIVVYTLVIIEGRESMAGGVPVPRGGTKEI